MSTTPATDWPIEEDDAEVLNPEGNAFVSAPAGPPSEPKAEATLPAASQTQPEKVEEAKAPDAPKPPVNPATPPPAAPPAVKVEDEPFPNDLAKALDLEKKLRGNARLGDKPTPAQRAAHARYQALRKHIYELQNGKPEKPMTAHSAGAFVGIHNAASTTTRWTIKARSDLDFKALLAAHDALAKENAELKKLLEEAAK
jgi:hypothetical protein